MQPFTFFISYRRQDTAPMALLLKNEIEKRLQFVRVSVDVEEMAPGQAFPDRLRQLIGRAHAVIALIGPRWMPGSGDDTGAGAGEDWVVRELEFARSEPLHMREEDRFGAQARHILPLFADGPRDFARFALPQSIAYLAELHAESIESASWPSAIGPLLDRIAVELQLKRRPDADEYPRPDPSKARTQPLGDEELNVTLSFDDYEGWYVDNFGDVEARFLTKTFQFRDFDEASAFMAMVGEHCRVMDHHPEWRNVFNHVNVSLTTWDAHRRVTIYDLNLALYMNMAARAVRKDALG